MVAPGGTPSGPEWEAFRIEQVSRFVAEVRDTLERRHAGTRLSAAVIADTVTARRRHGQDWPRWIRGGLLDLAFPMCYQPSTSGVSTQLSGLRETVGTERVAPGIACYNQPAREAAAKLVVARGMGFRLVALYSYDSLYGQAGYASRLEGLMNLMRGGGDGAR
jgi:uncharacterized lipoprotein YddW (UPF0748 family)